ncbi:3-hydroxybutyrate dehydrogenase [Bacillus sp. FJAT-47783]|uniref:3-hydroxybutyrate dehydrogenase n=1 Tax=Bacillus sp. FJAT-47783 TaxID=2922712 RepID=UPI001FABF16E|nr:3-hydroxybutyrate dehydrogenase [Bacillus sp. FJAT-47783]
MVKNRVAIVTGSAQGIGLEIAKMLAFSGAKVVLSDLQEDKIEQEATSLTSQGFNASAICCNVTDEQDIIKLVDATTKKYGQIDILINNAGLQHVAHIEDFPTEKFEQLLKVMLVGPFMLMKHVMPMMKKQRYGRVLNMASINGLVGFAGKSAYNSAKHGVIGLTKVAALEGAEHGVTVNALCPGYVDTPLVRNQLKDLAETRNVAFEKVLEEVIYPLVPQKRLLTVEEIADYVVYLVSEKAKGITGQAIVIDGGYTAQ